MEMPRQCCPECGRQTPTEAPRGLCPHCLLKLGAITAADDPVSNGDGAASAEKPGSRISHYQLLEIIGEGGFGTVWMAEQLEPVRRCVAL